jgi:hypothetical protein
MENKKKDLTTTITVKVSTRKRLNMWKYNLDCKTVDEVIDRILKIIPASELKDIKQ